MRKLLSSIFREFVTLVRAITSFGKVEKRLKNATGQPKKEVLRYSTCLTLLWTLIWLGENEKKTFLQPPIQSSSSQIRLDKTPTSQNLVHKVYGVSGIFLTFTGHCNYWNFKLIFGRKKGWFGNAQKVSILGDATSHKSTNTKGIRNQKIVRNLSKGKQIQVHYIIDICFYFNWFKSQLTYLS